MNKTNFLLIAIAIFLLSSCASVKKSQFDFLMFQRGLDSMGKVNAEEILIKPSDKLNIQFYTQATTAQDQTEIFNLLNKSGYTVDINGNLSFPIIGMVKAAGLTNKQLADTLIKLSAPYIKNPFVNVVQQPIKVFLLGNLKKQDVVALPPENANLLYLFALSGGENSNSDIRKVMVIREDSLKNRKANIVDMTSGAFFTSPVFQLQTNDLIYINPNSRYLREEEARSSYLKTQKLQPLMFYVTATSTVLSLLIILKSIK
ncbi:MAG: polysaccharide biosynthesis/export family protein [Bacteroidetes bacterium]|nr:polysaccharide biosynthesis/export family protein [Bacteroidota bacterium]MBS1649287.1 polysaccharide biosynthesis/export family protein [Bacteroidota bacterium]